MRVFPLLLCLLIASGFGTSCLGIVEDNNERIELERGSECNDDEECIGDLICELRICVEILDGNAA